MKKKLLALIAILCISAMTLAACGGGGGGSTTAAPADSGEAAAEAPAETAPAAVAETYDVGDFTFDLPAGWTAFPQKDIFADEDEDGNKPMDPASIYISRDATEEWEILTVPYMYITCQNPGVTHISAKDTFYENTEDLDVTIEGGTIEEAYEGDSAILDNWRYQIIHFATDNAQFDVTIPTIIEGEEIGYTVDDPEVMAVINSLAGK